LERLGLAIIGLAISQKITRAIEEKILGPQNIGLTTPASNQKTA
jgi:hypothetical protein